VPQRLDLGELLPALFKLVKWLKFQWFDPSLNG
jgi:hypothetical protein